MIFFLCVCAIPIIIIAIFLVGAILILSEGADDDRDIYKNNK